MIELSRLAGYEGVIQIELCPFHSRNLPEKNALLKHYNTNSQLKHYEKLLKEILSENSVITLAAVGTSAPISIASITTRHWLNWQANLIGFNSELGKVLPITRKDKKVTSAFVYSESASSVNGFILMMGGNHFSKLEYLTSVSEILRQKIAAYLI